MIQSLGAGSIPRVGDITLDLRVLGFTLSATLLTGLLFGLVPAWHASRTTAAAVLKEGGRSSAAAGGRWIRSGLLVVEVALSIVLLVGAALLLRSFAKLTNVDPGFEPDHVLAFQVSLPPRSYSQPARQMTFFDTLLAKLGATPGVRNAAMVQRLPMIGGYVLSFDVRGRPKAKPGEEPSANHRVISPDYFKAMGIPILRGRGFTPEDTATGMKVALVDEAFVKRHFPNENPIGQGLDIGNGTDGFYEIVGVAGEVRDTGLQSAPEPTMYVPYTQDVFSTMWIVARADGDPAQLAGPAREVVRSLDRTLPAYSMNPLSTVISSSIAQQRFSMMLLAGFALIALFLAAVGLYGVVAYSVSQRTREIGLRMAIGAEPGQVLRMVVGGGMKLAIAGVVIGLAGAIALSHFVTTLLFDVTPGDPISYAATALVLLAIAALACYVPARKAMKVDPLLAMQGE